MSRKIEVGTETFVRFWLVIIGFALAIAFIMQAHTALLIVGAAMFLAVAINPLVKKLDRSDKRRGLSTIIAVVLIVSVIGIIVAVVGPVVVKEAIKFFADRPSTGMQGAETLDQIGRSFGIENLSSEIWKVANDFFHNNVLAGLGDTVVSGVGTVVNIGTGVVLTLVLTVLFLLEGPEILDKFWRAVSFYNKEVSEVWRRIVMKMADVVAKYVTGQLMVAILDGCVSALIVVILSLIFGFSTELAVPMGLTTLVCYMIPMVGPIIGAIVVGAVLFFSSPWAGLAFVVSYIVYQQIEGNFIAPKVQGNRLRLPITVILVSIVVGMYVFGLLGAIISIPVAGCIKVLISEYPNIKKLHE